MAFYTNDKNQFQELKKCKKVKRIQSRELTFIIGFIYIIMGKSQAAFLYLK